VLDDKIVGFGSLDIKKRDYLDFLYVHKDYLRRGIASSLLDVLHLGKLKTSGGGGGLSSDVSITALLFFERDGFKIQRENINVMSNGVEFVNYHMRQEESF